MRNYELEVLDDDGSIHRYRIHASNVFAALHLAPLVAVQYGHSVLDVISVSVAQLTDDADMSAAITHLYLRSA